MTSQNILGQAVALVESLGWMPFITAFGVAAIAFSLYNKFVNRD